MDLGALQTAAIVCAAAGIGLRAAPTARAQTEPAYEARAHAPSPRIARAAHDATATATRVDLTERPAPIESVADVVAAVPGTRAIQTGGYGSFANVSLRGNEPAHTTWLLGEAPLSDPESGSFDASLLPLGLFERIEVYRGGAPLWLSQGAIAGAVRLVPRENAGRGLEARLGAGSYGLRQGLVMAHVRPERAPRLSWFTSAQLTHSDGDFPYVDDRMTRFDASDDIELRMRNAEVTDAAGLSHLRAPLLDGELDAVAFGVRRLGGVPGAAGLGINALQTRRALLLALLSVAYTHRGHIAGGRSYKLQVAASGRGTSTEFDDPAGEFGGGGARATTDTRLHGFGRFAASAELTPFLETAAIASYARTDGERRDALRRAPLGNFDRQTAAGAFELRLFGAPFGRSSELRASARTEHTRVAADVFERGRARHDDHDGSGQAYRAALATSLWPFLQLRGSVGRGTRAPAAKELFGDSVGVRPNTDLVPERGLYADAGTLITHQGESLNANLELTAFAQQVDDKIVYVSVNDVEARAINLGEAEIRGVEAGFDVEASFGPRLVASTTLLQTRTHTGRQLPLRPKLRAHGWLEQSLRPKRRWAERVTAFVSLDHESSAFYDQANEVLRRPLTRVGCGVLLTMLRERIELAARVSDVFDARGQDYLRFPLPGRSLFLLATIREATP